jgi:hypothetical protein
MTCKLFGDWQNICKVRKLAKQVSLFFVSLVMSFCGKMFWFAVLFYGWMMISTNVHFLSFSKGMLE